jgi:excinuclease ABC subunit B
LIQTIGRAARNANGQVIMYADVVTRSMEAAITETERRRAVQEAYNQANGIVPTTIVKGVRDVIDIGGVDRDEGKRGGRRSKDDKKKTEINLRGEALEQYIEQLSAEMKAAARALEFEKAAYLRDEIAKLRAKK